METINAYGNLILNLTDNVLEEVIDKDTIWRKLDEFYHVKDLSNRAFVRERLFTYKMVGCKKCLTDNFNDFKKSPRNAKVLLQFRQEGVVS